MIVTTKTSKTNKRISHYKRLRALIIICFLLIVVGCGSSGDDGIIGTGITYGAASTGQPVANRDVYIKSSSGENLTAQTDALGLYEILGIPANEAFLIRIAKEDGTHLYGIGHLKDETRLRRNIHPYTDLIVRNWFSVNGLDINEEFNGTDPISEMPSEEAINNVETAFNKVVSSALIEFGVGADVDLLSTAFDTEESAFNSFLQNSKVILNDGKINVVFKEEGTGVENYAIDSVALNTDYAVNTNDNPETPDKVRAVAAGANSIQVVWAAAKDDKGVKNYNIYRDQELVGTTPFSIYQDGSLDASLSYSYEVQAEDSNEDESDRSMATAMVSPGQVGAPPPSAPFNLTVESLTLQLTFNWEHANLDSILYFKIFDTSAASGDNLIGVTTDTSYTSYRIVPGCFTVVAFQAENNQSVASNEVCTEEGLAGISYLSIPATLNVAQNVNGALSVERTGNLSGAISVEYTYSDVTAVTGLDYQPADGVTTDVLTWEDGDGVAKDIIFNTLVVDDLFPGPKYFLIELANPLYVGNSGAIPPVIQSSTISTITIDPP